MYKIVPFLISLLTIPVFGQNNYVAIQGTIISETGFCAVDYGNIAGLDSSASEGYDSGADIPEPIPPPANYLSLSFPHPEWGLTFGDYFMRDLRDADDNLIDAVKIYDFVVATDLIGDTVDLVFSVGLDYPAAYGIVLYDNESESYSNIREDSAYTFIAQMAPRMFSLRLGDGTAPQIEILFPSPDTVLFCDSVYSILWNCIDVSPIRTTEIYYSLNNGLNWIFIDSLAGAAANYMWTIPDTISTETQLKIVAEDWAGNTGMGITPGSFTIAPYSPVIVTLTPFNPPIQIPLQGGNFEFNIAVSNSTPQNYNIDIWTMVTLPNGSLYGPIINFQNFNIIPNWSGDRDRIQFVPAGAPPGQYYYRAYVGEYPNEIWHEDAFGFTKSGEGIDLSFSPGWENYGGDFKSEASLSADYQPQNLASLSAYPNPFNNITAIAFDLKENSAVELIVFDICGKEVVKLFEGRLPSGVHSAEFPSGDYASGLYFARLTSNGQPSPVMKLVLVK